MMPQDDGLYNVYLALYDLAASPQKKNAILTALMGADEQSWRVVGVTEEALAVLATKDFQKCEEVRRAHIVPRFDIARALLYRGEGARPLDQKNFLWFYRELDKTVLVVKGQNKTNPPEVLTFSDSRPVRFRCEDIGYTHCDEDADELRRLNDAHQLQPMAPVEPRSLLDVSALRMLDESRKHWPVRKRGGKKAASVAEGQPA